VATVGITAFGLFWATSRSDAVSVHRQIRVAENAIDQRVFSIAENQEVVAVWDEAYLKTRYPVDVRWVGENVGVWLHDLFHHDYVYILGPRDEPVYGMVDGRSSTPGGYQVIRPDLQALVDEVRGRKPPLSQRYSRLSQADTPEPPARGLKTTERAEHASQLMRVFGRPAAASVMKILPLTDALPRPPPGTESLLISVRFLDRTFLDELAEQSLLDGARYASNDERAPGEAALALNTASGERIGYIIWRPELPGSELLSVLGPLGALSAVLVIAVMGLLVRTLWRASNELKGSEAQAQHAATHDPLTGLPNRALFNHRLEQELGRVRDEGARMALLTLDLDRFKSVNDTLGHQAGDALIQEYARRLVRSLRADDWVARLSGDEFAVIQSNVVGPPDAQVLCARILKELQRPFDIFGHQVFVGVSIGVALAPDTASQMDELLRRADVALYRAKREGRNCFRLFSESMDENLVVRRRIENGLRSALENDELHVCYQPEMSRDGRQVLGLEMLLRWHDPEEGPIPPAEFIPIAEETGLIVPLGEWVFGEACKAAERWPDLTVAVNISPAQLRMEGFPDRLLEIVRSNGCEPERFELEITESVILDGDQASHAALERLRDAGFKLALDDFGTGYSSLSYLRRFQVDKIKIDRSFIEHLGARDDDAIVAAIVNLGKILGIRVTAEGVETAEQHRFLEATGCDELQGYYFSRPLPRDELAEFLARHAAVRVAA
jgi:diguanylate cyclase (GGDEF)-like protein